MRAFVAWTVVAGILLGAVPAPAQQNNPSAPEVFASSGPAAAVDEAEAAKPDAAKPAPGAAPQMTAPVATAAGGAGGLVDSLSTDPIDFNFQGADLGTVLRGFSLKFGKNFVTGPGVSGRVTLQLHGVPFDEAFNTLLHHLGLVAVQRSNSVIEIIKAADMPVLSQVFNLKYRFAPDVITGLLNSLPKKERGETLIAVDQASNSLLVSANTEMLQRIKRIIDQIDVEAPQVAIKARLIEVAVNNTVNWGVTWLAQSQYNHGPQANGTSRGMFNPGTYTQNANINGGAATGPIGSINTQQALTGFPTGGVFDISAVLDQKTYYGLVNAIKSDSHAKTISEPMVLTGNNKSSKIHVGENLPVQTTTVNQNTTVQNITYIPEGVDLEVTPIVSPGSTVISVKIRVNVSQLLSFQNNAPITTERSATTEVTVDSGKTVVIGGLIQDSNTDTNAGIPILKDIPLLGYLFKNRNKTKQKTELLIFITPELLAKDTPVHAEPF